jgi:hypothetical protein
MQFNKFRDELSVLRRDVETAQKAYEALSERASNSKLQALTNQTNIQRLATAVEPLRAVAAPRPSWRCWSRPSAGLLLAIACAVLLELMNRRVRSVDDLSLATGCRSWVAAGATTAGNRWPCWPTARRRPALGLPREPRMNSQILPGCTATSTSSGPARDRFAQPIGALLVDAGRITSEEAERIHDYQKKVGLPFGEAGISMGLLTDEDVRQALALQFGHASLSPRCRAGQGPGRRLRAGQPGRRAPAQPAQRS